MVIGMRTLKLAAGGAAAKSESQRMIAEKIAAAAELPFALATSGGTSPEALTKSTLRHYTKKVRANRKRLSGQSAKSR
jgi:6-phosphogluconolactonase/glucosamine-6-phosphate isomerase/deaminase